MQGSLSHIPAWPTWMPVCLSGRAHKNATIKLKFSSKVRNFILLLLLMRVAAAVMHKNGQTTKSI